MRTAIAIGLAVMGAAWPHATAAQQRDQPAMTLRVHDYAGVPAGPLAHAQRLVASFYDRVGVRTRWAGTIARWIGGGRARASGPIEDVTVIVLNRWMAEGKPCAQRGTLGFAAITRQPPGRVAYVVYDRVDVAAADSDWTLADLLSVVITHEIAHLLLPPGSHSADGLMRGDWTIDDLRRTDPRSLRFTARQGQLLRAGAGEPHVAIAGPEAQIVGELRITP